MGMCGGEVALLLGGFGNEGRFVGLPSFFLASMLYACIFYTSSGAPFLAPTQHFCLNDDA